MSQVLGAAAQSTVRVLVWVNTIWRRSSTMFAAVKVPFASTLTFRWVELSQGGPLLVVGWWVTHCDSVTLDEGG
jgi:hypothetical protein